MTAIALIPARGGSKRIPKKNLQCVGDDSLVGKAVLTAKESGLFDHIILSTDSNEIARDAKSYLDDLIIFRRPSVLAKDDTPMLPVVHHAVEEYTKRYKNPPDDIVLLQPTSPFRTADDVKGAYAFYKERRADAVVSVAAPEADLVFRVGHAGRMRADPGVVVPNGAIYILWVGALICGHDWYSGVSYAYPMPKERSIDIDTQADLIAARAVLEHNYVSL